MEKRLGKVAAVALIVAGSLYGCKTLDLNFAPELTTMYTLNKVYSSEQVKKIPQIVNNALEKAIKE